MAIEQGLNESGGDPVRQRLEYYKREQVIPYIVEALKIAQLADSDFIIGHDTIVPPNDNIPAELLTDIEPPSPDAVEVPQIQDLGHRVLFTSADLVLI